MQTAIIGEADIVCTKDDDFFSLIHLLRAMIRIWARVGRLRE
jgi:hypothetical protein